MVNNVCAPKVGLPVTVNTAVPLVRPATNAVTVALPGVDAARFVVAMPDEGVTGEDGLKDPETPLTANVTWLVALETMVPLTSCNCAVYVTGTPVCALATAGTRTTRVAALAPCATLSVPLARLNP